MEPSTAPLSALAYVLRAKIGITLVFWCVPLLYFPKCFRNGWDLEK